MNKTLCNTHSEEIAELRKVKHKNSNEISKLTLMHQDNCKDIESIKTDIEDIKTNHLSHIETDIAGMKKDIEWLKESYSRLDKKFWALVIMGLGTLLGTFINFLT